jgi:hypothetical protein
VLGATYNGAEVAGAAQAIETDTRPGSFGFTDGTAPGGTTTPPPPPPPPPPATGTPVAWLTSASAVGTELYGTAGNDWVLPGAGFQGIHGGAGADVFAFRPGEGNDWLNDYRPAEGDRILLVGVNAADIRTEAFVASGTPGLRLFYGPSFSDRVFLQDVGSLDPSTLIIRPALPALTTDLALT